MLLHLNKSFNQFVFCSHYNYVYATITIFSYNYNLKRRLFFLKAKQT
ncbi:hypothetical protein EZS27_010158 [termite gut metagenome]|uniref:Uncharacterized protein n=1 Tax=termite gut metagenome TaxID=433724 RepID=A0A5J4S7K9_9ZZZZ